MTPGPSEYVLAVPAGTNPPADVWSELDMPAITSSLNSTGVWAPQDQQDQVPGLTALVREAAGDGHNLHVVILDASFPKFTAYRDIASELQSHVGGTVLVYGPSGSGTASSEFSRVQLEDGSGNVTKGSTITEAASTVYHSATDPAVNWNGVTIGLIAVVVIAAVVARIRHRRVVAPGESDAPVGSTVTRSGGDPDSISHVTEL